LNALNFFRRRSDALSFAHSAGFFMTQKLSSPPVQPAPISTLSATTPRRGGTVLQAAMGAALLLALQWGTLAERAPDQGAWGQRAADLMREIAPTAKSGSAESAFETRLAQSAQGDAGDSSDLLLGRGASDANEALSQIAAGAVAQQITASASAPLPVGALSSAKLAPSSAIAALAQQGSAAAAGQLHAQGGALSVVSAMDSKAVDAPAPTALNSAGGPSPAPSGAAVPAAVALAPGQKQLFLVAGDSLGDGYGQAARARFPRQSAWEAFDAGRHSTGLANSSYHDWPRALRDLVKQRKPQAVGLSVGANDTLDLRTDAGWAHFGSDAWKAEYLARARAFIRAGTDAGAKVAVFGIPPMENAAFDQKMRVIDQVLLQAAQAENAVYVPANPVFGSKAFIREAVVNGHRWQLRAGDGIHMTFQGYTIEVDDALKALGIQPDAPGVAVASAGKAAKGAPAQKTAPQSASTEATDTDSTPSAPSAGEDAAAAPGGPKGAAGKNSPDDTVATVQ